MTYPRPYDLVIYFTAGSCRLCEYLFLLIKGSLARVWVHRTPLQEGQHHRCWKKSHFLCLHEILQWSSRNFQNRIFKNNRSSALPRPLTSLSQNLTWLLSQNWKRSNTFKNSSGPSLILTATSPVTKCLNSSTNVPSVTSCTHQPQPQCLLLLSSSSQLSVWEFGSLLVSRVSGRIGLSGSLDHCLFTSHVSQVWFTTSFTTCLSLADTEKQAKWWFLRMETESSMELRDWWSVWWLLSLEFCSFQ